MLKLPYASSNYTISLLNTSLDSIQLPSVTVRKKQIFNERYTSDTSESIYSFNARSGNKMIFYSDTCRNDGKVRCRVCAKKIEMRDNTGVITSVLFVERVMEVRRTLVTCCHQCSMYLIEEEEKKGRDMQQEFVHSRSHHITLYNLQYPDGPPLEARKSPEVLKVYGGSMSRKEWAKVSHCLYKTPILNVVDMKSTYLKIKAK